MAARVGPSISTSFSTPRRSGSTRIEGEDQWLPSDGSGWAIWAGSRHCAPHPDEGSRPAVPRASREPTGRREPRAWWVSGGGSALARMVPLLVRNDREAMPFSIADATEDIDDRLGMAEAASATAATAATATATPSRAQVPQEIMIGARPCRRAQQVIRRRDPIAATPARPGLASRYRGGKSPPASRSGPPCHRRGPPPPAVSRRAPSPPEPARQRQ